MNLAQVVESLLFASQEPLSEKVIVNAIRAVLKETGGKEEKKSLGKVAEQDVTGAIEELNRGYARRKHAFGLVEGPAGWKVHTRPDYAVWVRQLFPGPKSSRLSPPALETLAIIAYRQPITKADIEAVRGVNVDGVLQTIMDRGLVHIVGRADLPGRPLLYETTIAFLEHFGIKNLDDLPNSAELRSVSLPTAEVHAGNAESEGDAPVEEQLAFSATAAARAGGNEESTDAPADSEEKDTVEPPVPVSDGGES